MCVAFLIITSFPPDVWGYAQESWAEYPVEKQSLIWMRGNARRLEAVALCYSLSGGAVSHSITLIRIFGGFVSPIPTGVLHPAVNVNSLAFMWHPHSSLKSGFRMPHPARLNLANRRLHPNLYHVVRGECEHIDGALSWIIALLQEKQRAASICNGTSNRKDHKFASTHV
ncbi:uncharacterized protein EI90DRAFT_1398764 [Cantharellus anzutake]|uniref:uncharacterized protein n=1 Tax=Cantharellus anzutake TaxID=1750568 RepID=UPI001902CA77|nr:uncharacterized protein EI90DRAFT_1398764 [Cantharellus anzutake]KAF8329466.1 hypothetical protein EI90DRAFT_1398764 [Cantharellus anzutake]